MNDALDRGAWAQGGAHFIHLIVRHPNYLTISLLLQQGESTVNMRLENTKQHVVVRVWTQLLVTTNQCVTTKTTVVVESWINGYKLTHSDKSLSLNNFNMSNFYVAMHSRKKGYN